MPRSARVLVPKLLHHGTQRGNHRMDVFFDDEDRNCFLEQLAHYTTKAGVSIVSYCLVTNHTHLLLVPSDEEALAKALKPLHMRYSQYLNHRFSDTGLNWQGRFFSAPLRPLWFQSSCSNHRGHGVTQRSSYLPPLWFPPMGPTVSGG
jgi:putative transposase